MVLRIIENICQFSNLQQLVLYAIKTGTLVDIW